MNDKHIRGPHQGIALESERARFAAELFDRLWDTYRQRVAHVATYERVVQQAGARFVNDHIAFRTFAGQQPLTGISWLSRIFEALGYRAAGHYHFEDKHLTAQHLEHPCAELPKLFISELKIWELSPDVAQRIERALENHRPAISTGALRVLDSLDASPDASARPALMSEVLGQFEQLPWPLPEKEDVLAVNESSQYAAWVLVHGYGVNHFTSLVNSHGVAELDDLEKTIAALSAAGVPMKASIEGERGSKLRQSATEAVMIDVDVAEHGRPSRMPWTYAYFELAERNLVTDPITGRQVRFEGFLGPQATKLFEMTRVAQGQAS